MNEYAIPPLLGAVINLVLIPVIFINNRQPRVVVAYLFFNVSFLAWNITAFLLLNAPSKPYALMVQHVDSVVLVLLPLSIYFFAIMLTNRKRKRYYVLLGLGCAVAFFLMLLHFHYDVFLNDVVQNRFGYRAFTSPDNALGNMLHALYILFFLILSQVILFREMARSTGQRRNQYRLIFWGTIIGWSGSLVNLAAILAGVEIYYYGYVTFLVYYLTVAYALITVKMVDMRYVLLRVRFWCTIGALFGLFAWMIHLLWIRDDLFLSLCIALPLTYVAYHLLNLAPAIRRFLSTQNPEWEEGLQRFSFTVMSALDHKQLMMSSLSRIERLLGVRSVACRLLVEGRVLAASLSVRVMGPAPVIKIVDDADTDVPNNDILSDGIVVREEVERMVEMRRAVGRPERVACQFLQREELAVYVPLAPEAGPKGVLLLGNKFSGGVFTSSEINALTLFKRSLEIALRNIYNHERIKTVEVQLEKEQLNANKIEAVGVLAGGIAHDFNNLLATIIGNIDLIRLFSRIREKQEDLDGCLVDMEQAGMQARNLTKQLLILSKGGTPVKEAASIDSLLREITSFCLRGTEVEANIDIGADVWPVAADIGQISQVFQNIVINAVQSIPDAGHIYLSCENLELTADANPPLAPGRYVLVRIRDEGEGINPDELDRIFDPYFTTKDNGNGLGLAICYSVVKKHGGHISVTSELGQGSTFAVYLPATMSNNVPRRESDRDRVKTGQGRILVSDDEFEVLKLYQRALRLLGYDMTGVKNGQEAIEVYHQAVEEGAPFDVVILDLVVPGGMGGVKTIEKLKELDPEVKGIVASGYSNEPVIADYQDYGFIGCLRKPFQIKELSDALQSAIAG